MSCLIVYLFALSLSIWIRYSFLHKSVLIQFPRDRDRVHVHVVFVLSISCMIDSIVICLSMQVFKLGSRREQQYY